MNKLDASPQVMCSKIVPFSEADVAQAAKIPFSDKVLKIIAKYKVKRLQALGGEEKAVETLIKEYWNIS